MLFGEQKHQTIKLVRTISVAEICRWKFWWCQKVWQYTQQELWMCAWSCGCSSSKCLICLRWDDMALFEDRVIHDNFCIFAISWGAWLFSWPHTNTIYICIYLYSTLYVCHRYAINIHQIIISHQSRFYKMVGLYLQYRWNCSCLLYLFPTDIQ